MDQQQQQQMQMIQEAAYAVVRPDTDPTTRAAASRCLEEWTATQGAWDLYGVWLESFLNTASTNQQDNSSVQLLCLQLLQSKIRREVGYYHSNETGAGSHHGGPPPVAAALQPALERIQSALYHLLHHPHLSSAIMNPACICMAALMVRLGQLPRQIPALIATVHQDKNGLLFALRLLQHIPLEMEAVSTLTSAQIPQALEPYIGMVLEYLRNSLTTTLQANHDETLTMASIVAVQHWVQVAHITLSQLLLLKNNNNEGNMLECLVVLAFRMRSPSTGDGPPAGDGGAGPTACQALQDALSQPADSCTETRHQACQILLQAILSTTSLGSSNTIPYLYENDDDDEDILAYASLISTFVTEEIDQLVTTDQSVLLNLLLHLQRHELLRVRMQMLECFLTISEIGVSERHVVWQKPLFEQVTHVLWETVAYNDDVYSEDEILEYRRMAVDVLVACYFLLRSKYIQYFAQQIMNQQNDLLPIEAALFCLTSAAREVQARVKSRTVSLAQDRQDTVQAIWHIVHHVMRHSPALSTTHNNDPQQDRVLLLLVAMVQFLGAYATIVSSNASGEDLLQVLAFCQTTLVQLTTTTATTVHRSSLNPSTTPILEAAKAIRSLLIASSSSSTVQITPTALSECVQSVMQTALSTGGEEEEAMAVLAEGCTRLVVAQSKSNATTNNDQGLPKKQQQFLGFVLQPVLHRTNSALHALSQNNHSDTAGAAEETMAIVSLWQCLHVLQVIVRFCETTTEPVQKDLVHVILFPLLERVSQRASNLGPVLHMLLALHQQLLKTAPTLVAPHYLEPTIKYVVEALEHDQQPVSCVNFIACAVEAVGQSSPEAFSDLLNHVSSIVFRVWQQKGPDANPALVCGFFEMVKRYFLFCPSALLLNNSNQQQLGLIVSGAVECLIACQSEHESTRAVLNFLTQLFGWRTVRCVSEAVSHDLHRSAQVLDEQLAQHGSRTIEVCFSTLLGGGSQALGPACIDCIFAIALATVSWPIPEDPESSVARQWMECAFANIDFENSNAPNIVNTVIGLLVGFAREGPKTKPKAKLLLADFCLIHKGELSAETLISYSM